MFSNSLYQMHLNFTAALLEATIAARREMATDLMNFSASQSKPEIRKLLCDLRAMIA